ncbi:MAG: hypothetical protein A3K90_08020 [Pelodictyon luteolum]|uniref:Uncharacterized protein n=1 Tax=Pelodictyon luteolum TaxID=1100 RepID=A0A165L7A5_PELLU|nr:hypothetical protein [Pelodictyon luteolum]KZK73666.1 MAG: hypothetical protein A3K90_08020 [Pelodictyon luteolum]
MQDHTPNFAMHELSALNRELIAGTIHQLVDRFVADRTLDSESLLEFWVELPGMKRSRGTFRGGFLMPDSFVYLTDYFQSGPDGIQPCGAYSGGDLKQAWADLLDEFIYQVEIFTSPIPSTKGVTLELWAGNRKRPEGEWLYAVDKKIELL